MHSSPRTYRSTSTEGIGFTNLMPEKLDPENQRPEPQTRDNGTRQLATSANNERAAHFVSNRDSHMVQETGPSASPASSISGESLNNHKENQTPPGTPNPESPGTLTAARIEQLSLEQTDNARPRQERKPRPASQAPFNGSGKRTASTDPRHPLTEQDTRQGDPQSRNPPNGRSLSGHEPKRPRGNNQSGSSTKNSGSRQRIYPRGPTRNPNYSNLNTRKQFQPPGAVLKPRSGGELSSPWEGRDAEETERKPLQKPFKPPLDELPDPVDPVLILQPESSPISKDQLAAEVKGIYAGLVMVEAKCINIDAAQAAEPNVRLEADQWQALIALHRTLLYEHHDFLMATQHPSATPALRGLASKYSMPARMWRHGIHSFLEVLRFRRPDSQDYMLAFIYLAYQMMALLFETVPMFTDTWIECLGDLARYRMAIEEDREQHAIWGGVAGRWYNFASDRHPETGRLYHHLGILERPSVLKFFLYTKSLTCLIPFPNAKDSLTTLCTPIVQDQRNYYTDDNSAEAGIVTFLAMAFIGGSTTAKMEAAGSEALSRLARHATGKIREFGVELVISIAGAILERGSSQNWLWQRFNQVIYEDIKGCRPSANVPGLPPASRNETETQLLNLPTTQAPSFIMEFSYSAFGTLILLGQDQQSVQDLLPSVHIILSWFYSLHSLQSRTENDPERDKFGLLVNPEAFSWGRLSQFLNLTTTHQPIGARTVEFAKQGIFLTPERSEDARPLAEDYTIRGLIWTPQYYPSDWFSKQSDDGSRAIEDPSTHRARLDRVHWLAIYLAYRIEHLKFNPDNRNFYVPLDTSSAADTMPQDESIAMEPMPQPKLEPKPSIERASTVSRSCSTPSAHSTDDDYQMIGKPKKPNMSWAGVASTGVKIVDDEMQLE